jgi:hypothetical protein
LGESLISGSNHALKGTLGLWLHLSAADIGEAAGKYCQEGLILSIGSRYGSLALLGIPHEDLEASCLPLEPQDQRLLKLRGSCREVYGVISISRNGAIVNVNPRPPPEQIRHSVIPQNMHIMKTTPYYAKLRTLGLNQ